MSFLYIPRGVPPKRSFDEFLLHLCWLVGWIIRKSQNTPVGSPSTKYLFSFG